MYVIITVIEGRVNGDLITLHAHAHLHVQQRHAHAYSARSYRYKNDREVVISIY